MQFIRYIRLLIQEWVLWLFLGLDALAAFLTYARLVFPQVHVNPVSREVYFALPLVGFLIANFNIYRSLAPGADSKEGEKQKDRSTYEVLTKVMPSTGSIRWMRDYDFGNSFNVGWLADIDRLIAKSKDPEFEFLDPELETLKNDLVQKSKEFFEELAHVSFPSDKAGQQINSIPSGYSEDETRRFEQARERVNALADQAVEAYDRFIKQARRKL